MDDKSRALFDKACQLIPGGVNSPVRACHNVDSLPLFIAEAHGSHIIDVDGREYIDFILSWGPMILGHDHPAVTAAVSRRRCCWRLRPASAVLVCWRGCMSAATRRESRCLPSRSRCCFWRSARYCISCSADHWRSLRLLPLLSTM